MNDIIQTRDGYLWLATFGGLARFDGIKFTIFDVGNTPELKTNRFTRLFEDRAGDLWIVPEGEIGFIRCSRGHYTPFSTRNGLPSNKFNTVLLDREGAHWFGTDQGLGRMQEGKCITFTTKDGLDSNGISFLFEDSAGNLWIGTDKGLNRRSRGKLESLSRTLLIPQNRIVSIGEDEEKHLWFSTPDEVFQIKDGRLHMLISARDLANISVTEVNRDRRGVFWFSTGTGLLRWENGKVRAFTKRDGLSSNNISSFIVDREDNVWVGTQINGLNRIKEANIRSYGQDEGMPQGEVIPICGDGRGGVWIGSNGEGLFHYQDGHATHYTEKDGLTSGLIWSLLLDREQTLWVGTMEAGIFQFKNGKFSKINTDDGLSNNGVFALFQDREGNIWIGTANGLNRYRDGRITIFQTTDGLVHPIVKSITQDSRGALWIGTIGGISRLENGKFINFTTENGLSADFVRPIYEDADGTIWIGTYGGGLNRFKDGQFFHFTTKNGLYDNVVSRILEDGQGNLWMTCNRGIYRVNRRELNDFADKRRTFYYCYHYGIDEGMLSSECNGGGQPAGWRTEDGKLWFPTIKGVVMIDPRQSNTMPPEVIIEEIMADGIPLDREGEIRLPPGKKRVRFDYTGISFAAPEKVSFRFKLEGFDADWTEAGTMRTASYTNLRPGKYTFRVSAANSEGLWNREGASLNFRLRPFFYQTYWFYGICLVLIAGAAYGFFEYRVSRLKARERKLKMLVEEQTGKLALANRNLEQSNFKLEEANKMLEQLSNLDGLTGIANRRYFEQFIETEWRRALRENWPVSVIMIDIDYFKIYNDTYGHPAGDDCLKKIANALSVVNRAGDLVARYGGEEFVAVMAKTDLSGALHIARKMQERVERTALANAGSPAVKQVTISLGIAAALPRPGYHYMNLVQEADQALYQAKQAGRNCIHIAR